MNGNKINGNKVSAGGNRMMTKTESQFRAETRISRTALLMVGALLLILAGTVLQLDVLGYAHLNSDNIWFMSVIAEGLWNAAATPMQMPSLREVISFWPLLIVCSGFAILVSRRLSGGLREPATQNSRSEGRQDA